MVRHEGAIPVFPKRQRQAVKRLIRSVPDVLGADGKMVQLGDDAYRCFTGRSKGGGRYSPSATSDSKVEESRSGILFGQREAWHDGDRPVDESL